MQSSTEDPDSQETAHHKHAKSHNFVASLTNISQPVSRSLVSLPLISNKVKH